METKSYTKDVRVGNKFMEEFWEVIKANWPRWKSKCEWNILVGNHEMRRNKAMEYGSNDTRDLMNQNSPDYSNWNRVHPFLKVVKIGGVSFSHYFQNNNSDRPISSARMLLLKKHISCVAGHQQGFDYAEQLTDNKLIQSLIIGSCYYHKEEYKPQSNHHWRGTVLLKNVKNGMFDFERFSLDRL